MLSIHGELMAPDSAGHRGIVLVAGGDDAEVAQAAKRLELLTPLFTKSVPPGALVVAATWTAVVQLAATFGAAWHPRPALSAWVAEQAAARTAPPALTYAPPIGLTPFPWQSTGAQMIAAAGGALITDEPGTGKTITAILGLINWSRREHGWNGHPDSVCACGWTPSGIARPSLHDAWRRHAAEVAPLSPTVVVCPASVIDSWVEAWRTWAPHVRAVAWRGTPKKRDALVGSADVYVCSYETARQDVPIVNIKGPLRDLKPAALVIDECFPAGTMIATPSGARPIEFLRVGDEVIGVDHETGLPVVTTVRHTFERQTDEPLVEVQGVAMTPNHPVWTERGYVRADAVRPTDYVCSTLIKCTHADLRAELRVVPSGVRSHSAVDQSPEVLQPGVLGKVAHVRPGVRRIAGQPEAACGGLGEHAALAGEPGGTSAPGSAPARPGQPAARPGGAGEGSGHAARAGLPDAERGERAVDGAPEATGRTAGVGRGSADHDRPEGAVPARVQGRPGLAGADDRDRSGRGESQEPKGARGGHPAGPAADRTGLDNAQVLEPRGAGGYRSSDGEGHVGRRVLNIETGTGNYVAGGLLVHNCHLIKNHRSARSQAVRRLARTASCVVALSGTPITHHPGDLWPALAALDLHAAPSRDRWVKRYLDVLEGDYRDEVLGLNAATEPEFRLTLLGQHRRVAKADVLAQLPPKIYSVRTVDLPTRWRKVYDEFESQMLAELPDGTELSVMDVLAKLTHLAALSSAPADVEVTTETTAEGLTKEHVHLELKAPSWKVDALLEVLEERPDQPVVAFAPSKQLIRLAGAAAAEAGLRVGYVMGGQTPAERTATVDAFQAGELDLICVTTGAGGVGLTLTAARTVVFLQRPWSLVEAIQAEDRCHRIGSERHDSIEVIDIVARNTLDSRVRAVLRERAGQLADLVQDPRIVTELLGGSTTTTERKAS